MYVYPTIDFMMSIKRLNLREESRGECQLVLAMCDVYTAQQHTWRETITKSTYFQVTFDTCYSSIKVRECNHTGQCVAKWHGELYARTVLIDKRIIQILLKTVY